MQKTSLGRCQQSLQSQVCVLLNHGHSHGLATIPCGASNRWDKSRSCHQHLHTQGWEYFLVLLHVAWVSDWPQLAVSVVNIWPQVTTGMKRSRICPLSHKSPGLHVQYVLGTVHQCWLRAEGDTGGMELAGAALKAVLLNICQDNPSTSLRVLLLIYTIRREELESYHCKEEMVLYWLCHLFAKALGPQSNPLYTLSGETNSTSSAREQLPAAALSKAEQSVPFSVRIILQH